MKIHRIVTLALLTGALLMGCSSRRSPQAADLRVPRTSSNVVTQEQIQAIGSVSTVEDILIRLVPGIDSANGAIRIRGLQGSPLIVINGVPQGGTQIPVSPRDVSRIEVLRTGGEIAAYGFRGSGGVILISTR